MNNIIPSQLNLMDEIRWVSTEAARLAREGGDVDEREAYGERKQRLLDELARIAGDAGGDFSPPAIDTETGAVSDEAPVIVVRRGTLAAIGNPEIVEELVDVDEAEVPEWAPLNSEPEWTVGLRRISDERGGWATEDSHAVMSGWGGPWHVVSTDRRLSTATGTKVWTRRAPLDRFMAALGQAMALADRLNGSYAVEASKVRARQAFEERQRTD